MGSGDVDVYQIALDSHGNVWAVGGTTSKDMPITPGAIQTQPALGFLAALSPDGSQLVYGSYLGTGDDTPVSLTIDSQDNIYIAGLTHSPSFAATPGAYRSTVTPGAVEIFVTKFDSVAQKVVYSTLLGPVSSDPYGAYGCCQMILDGTGDLYVASDTSRADFPVTQAHTPIPGRTST